ncbi:MAG: response regulator [Candidatus Krumholzibacteriota bacterium]|nr:response regulator [Candidatus Krumholzibacteriota bacterium]
MRILVVDDNEEICEFMKDLLELHDCEVITSLSGEQALEKVKERVIDFAFLDIMLPGMDGVETMRKLQSRYPECGYILMSGVQPQIRVEEGLAGGALSFLRKPFQISDVLEALEKY